MNDLRTDILALLDRAFIAHLATADDDGAWSAPLHVYHDGFDLYWRSDADVRHSAALVKDPRAALSIVLSDAPDAELALQMAGSAERVELGPALLERFRGTASKEEAKRATRSWYRLRPSFIELIDTVRFGYDKRRLDLV